MWVHGGRAIARENGGKVGERGWGLGAYYTISKKAFQTDDFLRVRGADAARLNLPLQN